METFGELFLSASIELKVEVLSKEKRISQRLRTEKRKINLDSHPVYGVETVTVRQVR